MMLHQEKQLPNDLGRPLSTIILPIKSKTAAAKKQCFFYVFCIEHVEPSLHLYRLSKSKVYK